MPEHVYVRVESRLLRFSNLDKVFYPDAGFTKRDILTFYREISPWLLPHLRGRPMTLKRYPEGVTGPYFYEKHCPTFRPRWIETAEMGGVPYCLFNDLATLLWAVNLGSLELHPLLSRVPKVSQPTAMVFDLDPGPPAGLAECARVAIELKELLAGNDLACFAKTSGSKGMQLYVPLNTTVTFEQIKGFSRAVAETLELLHPKLVVSRMAKRLRPGKIFIDWSQNDQHKTTVSVYSMRAGPRPWISTPLEWSEIESVPPKGNAEHLRFEYDEVLRRVRARGDLFAPILTLKQTLPRRLLARTAA